jgi:glyoxylase-like metal-dependent hydrolase (beta-lactamase superfamily II)
VTANNGSMMTGPGTNTYLIGGGAENEWAVIDPGPLGEPHVRAVVDAAPGPIRRIFATHTHVDHSPATVLLKSLTGARVQAACPITASGRTPASPPRWRCRAASASRCRARRPARDPHAGHASNHICYLLKRRSCSSPATT